jgi:hypothetical protein
MMDMVHSRGSLTREPHAERTGRKQVTNLYIPEAEQVKHEQAALELGPESLEGLKQPVVSAV